MLDAHERLLACQAGGAGLRVVMITNGTVTVLASTSNGLKFYSPNDLVVKSDGTVWFTDPGYNGGICNPPRARRASPSRSTTSNSRPPTVSVRTKSRVSRR
jgi:sugar lactone lactonase YvrE